MPMMNHWLQRVCMSSMVLDYHTPNMLLVVRHDRQAEIKNTPVGCALFACTPVSTQSLMPAFTNASKHCDGMLDVYGVECSA